MAVKMERKLSSKLPEIHSETPQLTGAEKKGKMGCPYSMPSSIARHSSFPVSRWYEKRPNPKEAMNTLPLQHPPVVAPLAAPTRPELKPLVLQRADAQPPVHRHLPDTVLVVGAWFPHHGRRPQEGELQRGGVQSERAGVVADVPVEAPGGTHGEVLRPVGVELDGDVPRPRQRAPAAHAVAVRGDPGARAVVVDGDADGLEAQPAVAGIIRLGLAGEECGADNPAVEERRRVEPGVAAGDGVADEEGAVVVVEEEEAEVGVVELEVGGVGEEVEGEAPRGGGDR
uniref:Uncharacterized protein n=1 Tax=Oryza sativa subsp. japonica TaxID=39947 RepID=Q6K1V8_ORYSJ|nr:hypothetical protein [Oryza sativa Japonica Group]